MNHLKEEIWSSTIKSLSWLLLKENHKKRRNWKNIHKNRISSRGKARG
jgi:hypothetical protein